MQLLSAVNTYHNIFLWWNSFLKIKDTLRNRMLTKKHSRNHQYHKNEEMIESMLIFISIYCTDKAVNYPPFEYTLVPSDTYMIFHISDIFTSLWSFVLITENKKVYGSRCFRWISTLKRVFFCTSNSSKVILLKGYWKNVTWNRFSDSISTKKNRRLFLNILTVWCLNDIL